MLRKNWFLIFILLLGLFLRTFRITENALYGDELTIAQDAYSILKTGQSSTGKDLPLTFEMGAGRPGGYIYASLPFVYLFGPSEIGVRALSIISGLAIILLMYILAKYFFDEKVAKLAALLTAVSPWDLALSRGGFEAHFALALALLGTVSFLYSQKKPWLLLVSAFSWGATWHTYPTYKLTLPIFIGIFIWFKGKKYLLDKKIKKFTLVSALILLVFAGFSLRETLYSTSETRFADINLFGREDISENITQKINLERSFIKAPSGPTSLFHNKFFEYGKILTLSYFLNFNLNFLFVNGDGNPRHNPSELGYFYFIEILFVGLAVYQLLKSKSLKILKFLFLWILITPLATALLLEIHGLRNSFYLPPLIFLSSYGLSNFLKTKRKLKFVVLGAGLLLFIIYFERTYFLAPGKHASFWLAGAREAANIAKLEKDKHDWVIIFDESGNSKSAYPVYAKVDPKVVIAQKDIELKQYGNVFITNEPPSETPGTGLVIEVSGGEVSKFYVQ